MIKQLKVNFGLSYYNYLTFKMIVNNSFQNLGKSIEWIIKCLINEFNIKTIFLIYKSSINDCGYFFIWFFNKKLTESQNWMAWIITSSYDLYWKSIIKSYPSSKMYFFCYKNSEIWYWIFWIKLFDLKSIMKFIFFFLPMFKIVGFKCFYCWFFFLWKFFWLCMDDEKVIILCSWESINISSFG